MTIEMVKASFETDWENPDDAVYDKGLPPMAEKMAALDTKTYLEQRAQRGSREKSLTVLAQAPDVEPDLADRLAE